MNLFIEKIENNSGDVLQIAKKLPEYFTDSALKTMEEDFQGGFLCITKTQGARQVVGFVSYKPINNQTIEMVWLGIDPDFQSKGVGKFLVDETLKILSKDYKVCEVKTLAHTANYDSYTRTRKFYEQNGFIPLEIIDPYPGWEEGNPCQLYVKSIS